MTDATGAATFAACPPRAERRSALTARLGFFESERLELDCESTPEDEILLVLPAPGTLRPEVRALESRQPIVRAQVVVLPSVVPLAHTDDAGRARIEGLPPNRYSIAVSAEGRVRQRVDDLFIDSGHRLDVDVAMLQAGVITGHVRKADGAPIAEALVVARSSEKSQTQVEARTGADGSFAIDGLYPGMAVLDVSATGFVSKRLETPAPAKVRVVLEPGAAIEGRVELDGAPMSGVEVVATHFARDGALTPWAGRTDADGRYLVVGLPGGFFEVSVRTLDARGSNRVSVAPGKTAICDLALEYLNGRLGGRVIARPGGEPIANAMVTTREGPAAMTDEQGRFELEGLDEKVRVAEVVASAPGFATRSLKQVRPGIEQVVLELPQNVLIHGRVVAEDGSHVPSLALCEEHRGPRFEACQPVGSTEFLVEKDPEPDDPGQLLAVVAAGFRTESYAYLGRGPRVELGEIRLAPVRPLLFKVVDTASMPVQHAHVFEIQGGVRHLLAVTDRFGEARAEGRGGEHRYVAEHPLYAPSRDAAIRVVEGAAETLTLRLARAGWISGEIRYPDQSPTEGVTVVDLLSGASTLSDSAGQFRLGPLSAGEHALWGYAQVEERARAKEPRRREGKLGALPKNVRMIRLAEGEEQRLTLRWDGKRPGQ
ncbi:MAG: carboxypeptidase-like regulatory domain-containing protein [Myxococcales bacterium]